MTVLHTARLVLRRARASDLHDLHAIFGDPVAMRYWSSVPDPDLAATQTRLDRLSTPVDGPDTFFVLERDGRVVGTAGRYRGNEVGFMLHPGHWRQGLMHEAMQAILPYIWQVTSLPDLMADVDPRNTGSIRLLTSLGFAQSGQAKNTFHINGEWSDSLYFTLPRTSTAAG